MNKVDYRYKGFIPYGAAQMLCLDDYIPYDFTGNVIEYIISNAGGTFVIKDHGTAFLHIPTMSMGILFRKEDA